MPWYEKALGNDVVVSTRIRLARNLSDYPFLTKMSREQAQEVVNRCNEALKNSALGSTLKLYKMEELTQLEKQALVEKHLISPEMLNYGVGRAAIIDEQETMSILINEEDHIRIQTIQAGYHLKECYELADKIDDLMEESLPFAFDEKYGYLTCCPTNVGTGMRASVMVHLPALSLTGQIKKVLNAVSKFGMTVRGVYGEGSEASGNLYQISNQITLGLTERETLDKLSAIVMEVVEKEHQAQKALYTQNRLKVEDRIFRSLGILKNARLLSSEELMKLISDVNLGNYLGILKEVNTMQLIVTTSPATLLQQFGESLEPIARDEKRAQLVRESLKNLNEIQPEKEA